jgi:Tol biopolymer transport system component
MNSDGSGKTTVLETIAGYNTIRWSPDGDKIVFNKREKLEVTYNYTKGSNLFILDINSGAITQLTHFDSDSNDVFAHDWK